MKQLKIIHAGDILKTDFLDERNLTNENLAEGIEVDRDVVHQLVTGHGEFLVRWR